MWLVKRLALVTACSALVNINSYNPLWLCGLGRCTLPQMNSVLRYLHVYFSVLLFSILHCRIGSTDPQYYGTLNEDTEDVVISRDDADDYDAVAVVAVET